MKRSLAAFAVGLSMLLGGCGGDASFTPVVPVNGSLTTTPSVALRQSNVWQNPFMSVNPTNNIHNDSYMSDSYAMTGPSSASQSQVAQTSVQVINDPVTGQPKVVTLGECASQAFDRDGNIQTVSGGLAGPGATEIVRSIVTLDRTTMKILAYTSFTKALNSTGTGIDFGGAGYFYQDNQYRMVVALPDGHIQVLRRTPSIAGGVDGYHVDLDYNITGANGALPVPTNLKSLELYAVVPDKAGNIWFTVAQGIVGTVNPAGVVHYLDVNDPNRTGTQQPQPDGGYEAIANSHAVDEGDSSDGPSGVYVVTTYRQYRFSAAPDGTPRIDWSTPYDRGTAQKPGQVSFGSGTSPTIFRLGGRRFVTIADNAQFMHVNVYRAEATLQAGEQRLFAQISPFGSNALVSDENSLIVAPGSDGQSMDIYAENNWGNVGPEDTLGSRTTQPGFARVHLLTDGTISVASVNNTIAVPSIVSKVSLPSNIVYTYNKAVDGWYLTGLDADDLNTVRFTTRVGPGTPGFNNFYAGLSLDPDGRTVWLGTIFGLTRVQLSR